MWQLSRGNSPQEIFDDGVRRRDGRVDLLEILDVDLVVDPLQPAGALRVAVDQDQTVDHRRPSPGEPGQHVRAEADASRSDNQQ